MRAPTVSRILNVATHLALRAPSWLDVRELPTLSCPGVNTRAYHPRWFLHAFGKARCSGVVRAAMAATCSKFLQGIMRSVISSSRSAAQRRTPGAKTPSDHPTWCSLPCHQLPPHSHHSRARAATCALVRPDDLICDISVVELKRRIALLAAIAATSMHPPTGNFAKACASNNFRTVSKISSYRTISHFIEEFTGPGTQ